MMVFPVRNGGYNFGMVGEKSLRQSLGGPPGGRASDPYIAIAGNFFHPTHPRTHKNIRLTLLSQILIFWEKTIRKTANQNRSTDSTEG